jgi:long-chain acyl-CoA synthetase
MNLTDIISRHAGATPRASAVIEPGRVHSYLDFDRAIWRAAAALRDRGIAPGQIVGVTMRSTALHLVVAYALARIGAVQIALPRREAPQVRRALAVRFDVASIVGDSGDARQDGIAFHPADEAWLDPSSAPGSRGMAAPGGDAPWKIVMSSGTTGAPKAVLQTHAMHIAWREIYASAVPVLPGDRLLAVIELDFYAGLRQCMEMHWSGASAIVGVALRTPAEMIDAMQRHAATSLHLLPPHLHRLLPHLPADRNLFPGLRVLRSGAMIITEHLRREIRSKLTPNLFVTYGTNDLGSVLTCADAETQARHPGSVGLPSAGVQIEIVDDVGRRLAPGETGLIRARSPGMPRGYIDNAQATAAAFRDGWYYPGDLGMLSPEGALYFKGRADDLMNFDGIKIYPSDIEAVLAAHPAIAEAAAFPLASDRHQDVPAAAVVLKAAASHESIVAWCRERLGSRAPSVIAVLPTLPRNATGKVLKQVLAKTLQAAAAARRSRP